VKRLRRAATLCGLGLALGGCGRDAVGVPPPAPAPLTSPAQSVPADLDVLVRVDVARLRDALGVTQWTELSRRASLPSPVADAGTERFMTEALARADLAYLGLRPASSPEHVDNVVALSGNFSGLDPRREPSDPPWRRPIDLGGAVRRYDRDAPKQRTQPARIYAFGDTQLVLVSEAEIDSVERAVELGKRDGALEPPAQGVVSVAARLDALLARLTPGAPMLANLLQGAAKLEASADVTATGLRVAAALTFGEESHAGRFARECSGLAARLGQGVGAAGAVARATRIEALGKDVTLRVAVDRSVFGDIVACTAGSGCM
jgi:hypothetical protein